MDKELLKKFITETKIQSYLNELVSISRISALRFMVMMSKQLSQMQHTASDDKDFKLNKSHFIDSIEGPINAGYKLTIPESMEEKFSNIIGKMFRKMYLNAESNEGLTACKKAKIGNFMVDIRKKIARFRPSGKS